MKLLCDRQQLTDAFAVVAGIAPQKSTKPIAQNILVRCDKEAGLTLFATDFQMSARVVVEAVKVEKPGSVLLPARETMALLRELTEPTVTVRSGDHRTTLECGNGSFILLGGDPDEFPPETKLEEGVSLRISGERLAEMLRQTMFAVAREESRYAVNGVLFDCHDHCLRLVATDGRRLALTYENLDAKSSPDLRAILPQSAAQALLKVLLDDAEDEIEIVLGESQLGFKRDDTIIVSRILDANFPEYEAVVPKVAETSVEVPRGELEANLRRVSVLTGGDVRQVRFTFSSSTLQLAAESSGVGRADATVAVDVKGAGCGVSFNPDFFLDALRVADTDIVRIDLTDESTPAKISLGESFTYVLMPISG